MYPVTEIRGADGKFDYRAMATACAEKESISYARAAHAVMKRYGNEAREAFKRGPLVETHRR